MQEIFYGKFPPEQPSSLQLTIPATQPLTASFLQYATLVFIATISAMSLRGFLRSLRKVGICPQGVQVANATLV
jgi:hypothetical protein